MTPLAELLEQAGVEVRSSQKANEVTLCCPFCPERGFGEDTHYHLGLNLANGKAHCYKCSWRAGTALFTAKQLRRVLEVEFDISERRLRVSEREETVKEKPVVPEPVRLPAEYERLGSDMDDIGRRVLRYLRKRDVSLLQVVRHRIGYVAAGPLAWRAVFPVIGRDRKVYGYVARAVTADQQPKYLNSPGLKMLWNTEDASCHTAVVVEGVMDAIKVEGALLQQVSGYAAVARLGSTITSFQLEQLKAYDKVIILPDFDRAGMLGASELAVQCRAAGIRDLSIVIPDELTDEDPGAMDAIAIMTYIRAAVPWSAAMEYRIRLVAARGFSEH